MAIEMTVRTPMIRRKLTVRQDEKDKTLWTVEASGHKPLSFRAGTMGGAIEMAISQAHNLEEKESAPLYAETDDVPFGNQKPDGNPPTHGQSSLNGTAPTSTPDSAPPVNVTAATAPAKDETAPAPSRPKRGWKGHSNQPAEAMAS